MRKLFHAAALAALLMTPTLALADELPFDPLAESEVVLGEQAYSVLVGQARARVEMQQELAAVLDLLRARAELLADIEFLVSQSDEAVLGEQVRRFDPAATDALREAVRARVESLRERDEITDALATSASP